MVCTINVLYILYMYGIYVYDIYIFERLYVNIVINHIIITIMKQKSTSHQYYMVTAFRFLFLVWLPCYSCCRKY